eukprot:CAMPEP_0195628338 /NCGR_PEP_ID=MMETSP0815-20121206/19405_1 /TAXON_ID=97485 /ORGANISM="Prymnesium parvum, Strain Texoma1" /LENGTH=154 /DNA_ID=CAMNT_0040769619 /DNA_START=347 /DNA_END=812 /DNA_ORIENTATION=+
MPTHHVQKGESRWKIQDPNEREVRFQHHRTIAQDRIVLLSVVLPLAGIEKSSEILVVKTVRSCVPGPSKARIRHAADANRMCACKSNYIGIIEAHAVENAAQIGRSVVSPRQQARRCALLWARRVHSPHTEWHPRPAHHLDAHDRCQLPKVGVA